MEHPLKTALTGSRRGSDQNFRCEPRNVRKRDTKRIMELFAFGIPTSKAREYTADFQIGFEPQSFVLVCPELVDSLACRLKRVNTATKTTAEATDKSLVHQHKKLLNEARPTIETWSHLEE